MPRALFLCLTIVAAFAGRLAAAPVLAEDLLVWPDVAAAARELGLDPAVDRGRFVPELMRLLYTPPPGRNTVVVALQRAAQTVQAGTPLSGRVPVPLSAELWSRAIFRRSVDAERLLTAIASDRRAALICHTLAALDDDTLRYLAEHPAILTRLYDESAAAFAAFGSSLRIRSDRVEPPGGEEAAPLWEAAIGQPLARPDRFIQVLFEAYEGRLAYLYDVVASIDSASRRFALGLWIPEPQDRHAPFVALVKHVTGAYREWKLEAHPFSRPLYDLGMLLMRVRVDPTGRLAPPASRAFWEHVFGDDGLNPEDLGTLRAGEEDDPVDAVSLATAMAGNDLYWRGERLDQFSFGQRVFAALTPADWPSAIVAIRGFPRYRMLMLTLERMGVTAPQAYAAVLQRANRLPTGDPARSFWTLAQLQSTHALLLRMWAAGTLDSPMAEKLVLSLYEVELDDGEYRGGLASWVRADLLPALGSGAGPEDLLIAALAGPSPGEAAPRVFWEGADYRLDFAFAERQRLALVRSRQAGYSVDAALEVLEAAHALRSEPLDADKGRRAAARLQRLLDEHPDRIVPAGDERPAGVDAPRPARDVVQRAIAEIARADHDVRRMARAAPPLMTIVDEMLGEALLSLAYAASIGDPDGPALLARNVAVRHDFGFSRRDPTTRQRTIWALPRQDFLPGVPWHVTGSVLGLDLALGSFALRRISLDRLMSAPRLPSHERDGFAVSVALMNPRRLRNADRTAIAAAIARGQARVAALAAGGEAVDAVAEAIGMDGWRRRALPWMMANDPGSIPSMFSLGELLQLGGGAPGADLDAWGMLALGSRGCACTRFELPRLGRLLSGRSQIASIAPALPDLNLHVAVLLDALRLPAALARSVLAAAVQEFVEEVAPSDASDLLGVARGVDGITRDRVEDYVAAAAAVDGPLAPVEAEEAAQGR